MNKFFKQFFNILGIYIRLILGYTLLTIGLISEIWWLVAIGFLLVDLTPSFMKTVWKYSGENFK